MTRLVFLLEEPSMARFLEALLPRAFPGVPFLCIEHEGKRDLEQRLVPKLRAWNVPGDAFVVVRDQDADDCRALKRRLRKKCRQAGKSRAVVRIACRELEAWYLGDLESLAIEYGEPAIRKLGRRRRFRDPDRVHAPSTELCDLLPGFGKIDAARRMGVRIRLAGSSSRSFAVFLEGVERLAGPCRLREEE